MSANNIPRHLTTFEQVLLGNSLVIIASTLLTFVVTHFALEPYHYLLDTLAVLLAILAGVGVNALLLRHAFGPLFTMLRTIQAVQRGEQEHRVNAQGAPADIEQLAQTFNGMLDSLEATQQAALRAIAQAQEDERRRVALELHDATGQELTALVLKLALIEQDLEAERRMVEGDPLSDMDAPLTDHDALHQQLASAIQLAQRTMTGVRSLAQQLRPTVLDDLGLAAALRWLGQELGNRSPGKIQIKTDGGNVRLPPLVETMLFRVTQEALTNALRHSQARTIVVTFHCTGDRALVTIRDDGVGFTWPFAGSGIGIRGMSERMALVGGQCQIVSHPGQGATITASVPLPRKQEEA